jgi:hypothetical protein
MSPSAADTTTTATDTAATTPAGTTTASTPGQQALAQSYLAIIAPASEALGTFVTKANGWTDKTTNGQAASDAAPLSAALVQARHRLLRVQWPDSTQTGMRELVQAFDALTTDLAALGTLPMVSASTWQNRFTMDAAKAGTAAAVVRADLARPSAQG